MEEAGAHRYSGCVPGVSRSQIEFKILFCKIGGKNIADVVKLPLGEILTWLEEINDPIAVDRKAALQSRIQALIDMRSGAGTKSGEILFEDTPKQLLQSKPSVTRPYLEKALGK